MYSLSFPPLLSSPHPSPSRLKARIKCGKSTIRNLCLLSHELRREAREEKRDIEELIQQVFDRKKTYEAMKYQITQCDNERVAHKTWLHFDELELESLQ
jgi:hypothetical protein